MTEISYFQRYSQKENHVTNNTLLLMRYFYQASPAKLSEVLSKLVEDDLSVGLIFKQQVKESHSVPDALISQLPLEIYFESKLEELNESQLKNHIKSISDQHGFETKYLSRVLFGLTKRPVKYEEYEKIQRIAKSKNILFQSITYEQILRSFREVCKDHESALHEILSDYEDFLKTEKLLQIGQIMTVFPCGDSMEENIKHRLYFEPEERLSKKDSDFIGFYKNKRISYLGKINSVVVGTVKQSDFKCEVPEKGNLSQEEKKRILDAIHDCDYYPHLGKYRHRYYLLDEIHQTNFVKASYGGMRQRSDFYLNSWLNYRNQQEYEAHQIAEQLFDQEWR